MTGEQVKQNFFSKFPGTPAGEVAVYVSPGRVNLIGEHTDYNGGFVFPGAVDKGMIVAVRPNGTDKIRAWSIDLDRYAEFGLGECDAPGEQWARYIFGISREMQKRGVQVGGFDTAFAGDVPLGAGMSSSAALESVYAVALNEMFVGGLDRFELARAGQATEHNYVGVKCGIMDQFASLFGKAGHLVRLDTKSMEYEYFPFDPKGYRLVLLNSNVRHELASSAYNRRRESCERVVVEIAKIHPEVEFLRDADFAMLEEVKDRISGEDYKRAKYVIGETARVLAVSEALPRGDYETVGRMMYLTHEGMSRDYEVSCEELDFLNDLARRCGVTGSRVMGGGFGGCTINLVRDELYDGFIAAAKKEYTEKYGTEPLVYDVVISDGGRRLE